MEHDLYKNIENIYVCIDFEMLKVKVPIIFFGTQGFPARRDGHYCSLFNHLLKRVAAPCASI
jgi:hypothetical protein